METRIKNNLKKPCPFCGRWIGTELQYKPFLMIAAEGIEMRKRSQLWLICDSCGMHYVREFIVDTREEDAIEMFEEHWNSMVGMYEKVPVEDKKPDTSVFDALARAFSRSEEEDEETLEEYIDGEIEYCLDQLSGIDGGNDAWIHRHLGRIESLRHVKDWLEVYGED